MMGRRGDDRENALKGPINKGLRVEGRSLLLSAGDAPTVKRALVPAGKKGRKKV